MKKKVLISLSEELSAKLDMAGAKGLIPNKSAFIESLLRAGIRILEEKYGEINKHMKHLEDKEFDKNLKKELNK